MLNKETYYILKYNTLEPNGYNRFLPNEKIGFHMNGVKHSPETREWNAGLSKETDNRLKNIGDRIKIVKSKIK